ncbi:hypothetical protein QA612_00740 [Evansella sp. AB-P1]|uniref:hypothetical protein n=1 Tax=Evansella sp. AB-P1 TaxID=3037653 RepID=UPI00241F5B88|nr:hypothetical protein [Evansella sp. AB-P1]MDG5785996.1 hypothetical protein [Evansella sp. AB-P1]
MNRVDFVGSTLFIAGILLFGLVHLAIANYVPSMTGWSTPPGKFATARNDIMVTIPYFLSIILMLLGVILLLLKEIKSLLNKLYN